MVAGMSISRRELASGLLILAPHVVRGYQANSAIRMGWLGNGARGTAVLRAMTQVAPKTSPLRVTALGDLFPDKLAAARTRWNAKLPAGQAFTGAEAYKRIAEAKDVDAILLSTPNYWHAEHLDAIVTAGKHVYCEKPAGVDVESCLRFRAIGAKAKGRLSLAVGFQVRTAPAFAAVVDRVKKGAIGKVASMAGHYYATATPYPDYPGKSTLEKRIRRFFWDRVISGDVIVDQNIHILDIANWAMGANPVAATGRGGRYVRKDESDIWDTWGVVLTYPGGAQLTFNSTQFGDTYWDAGIRFFGEKGVGECFYSGVSRILGAEPFDGSPAKVATAKFSLDGAFDGLGNSDQNKARLFLESLSSPAKYLEETGTGADSALTAILAREACYRQGTFTWEELMASRQSYQGTVDLSALN
jgi:predicted dehydrogenase